LVTKEGVKEEEEGETMRAMSRTPSDHDEDPRVAPKEENWVHKKYVIYLMMKTRSYFIKL